MVSLTDSELFEAVPSDEYDNDSTSRLPLEDFNPESDEEDGENGIDDLVSRISSRFDIPESNVIVENGRISYIIDNDGEVINADDLEGMDDGSGDADDINANAGGNNASANGDGVEGGDGDEGDSQHEIDFGGVNIAIEVASRFGLEVDRMVDAQGAETMFADMDGLSQLEMVQQMVEMVRNEDPFENDIERQLISALRSGTNLLEIARGLVADDGAYLADSLSDYEVYLHQMVSSNPDVDEQDVQDEFEALPDALIAKKVTAYREVLRTQDVTGEILGRMERENEVLFETEYTQALSDFDRVFENLSAESRIDGVEVTPEVLSDLYQFVTAPSASERSPFLEELSTPEQVVNAAFWHRNIHAYKQSVDQYVNRINAENNSLKAQLKIQVEKGNAANTKRQTGKTAEIWNQANRSSMLPQEAELF